jgi:hypothetical protein
MVKTQADGEEDQHADDLRSRIEAMDPGVFVEIEKNIHIQLCSNG